MATGGGAGRLLEIVRSATHENATLGRALTTFGLVSVVGGVGFFAVTLTVPFEPGPLVTYQKLAAGLAGYGFPAFLYGLVIVLRGETWVTYVSLLGVLACALAVLLFLGTYPTQWDLATAPEYVVAGLGTYCLGAMLCSFGAGGAVGCPASDEEDGFVWGDPPEG